VVDEALKSSAGCNAWNDDAMEIYFDGNGDAIDTCCPGYGTDDFQLIIGAGNKDHDADPDLLNSGMLRAGGCVREGPILEAFRGVVLDLDSEDGSTGWQGEISIALQYMDAGEWSIDPVNGTTIGLDMHLDDDDHEGGQDATTSALIWSKRDPNSRAWQTPGVFGKLQFFGFEKPVLFITRDLPDGLRNGGAGAVSLSLDLQYGSGDVVVKEEVPQGIVPANATEGGVIAGQTITWGLSALAADKVLGYDIQVTAQAVDAEFASTATIDGEPVRILGDLAYTGSPFNVKGYIKLWNHLGPLAFNFPARANDHGPPGACDGIDPVTAVPQLPLDWIVDAGGGVTEAGVLPLPGMLARPKYGGDGLVGGTGARAAGLTVEPGDLGRVVRDRFPVWRGHLAPEDTIDHASAGVNGIDADDHVTLSCVYLTTPTGQEVKTLVGFGSDDAIQILVNGEDVTQGGLALCRPWTPVNEDLDEAPVALPAEESRILVKVADGGGASGFRLRFLDPSGDPSLPGLRAPEFTVSLESARNPRPGKVVRSLAKDAFGLGELVEVSLAATLAPAADLVLREVLPAGAGAESISDGGTLAGGVAEWRLNGTGQRTVSYRLAPGPCAGDISFGQSSFQVGAFDYLVEGPDRLSRADGDEPLGEWDSRDINAAAGGAEKLGDHDLVVKGAGDGVQFTADSFRFVSFPRTDDFEFSARIDCFDDPGGTGHAGLMVRDTFDAHSAQAFFYLSSALPAGGGVGTLKGIFRPATKPNTGVKPVPIVQKDVASLPLYLKLKRTGAKLSIQRSADG
ncbi:MAG: sugar-binding protein, partial [Thermoanaerobaculia bacterium]